jgi:hypothetical protein
MSRVVSTIRLIVIFETPIVRKCLIAFLKW